MTRQVTTCRPTNNLSRAAQLMWERRCGCLPVVDDDGRPVGILTDRDVCMGAYTQGRRLNSIDVATAMVSPVRTCQASTRVEDAEALMMANGIRRVVVVGEDGRLTGLLSLDDGKGEVDLERVAVTLGEIALCKHHPEDQPDSKVADTDMSAFVQNSLEALATMRQEIQADLHLASNEMRDRWRRLEMRLHAAERHGRDTRRGVPDYLDRLAALARRFRAQLVGAPAPDARHLRGG